MIFVTGGTGLTGAHLLYELTSKGRRVKALKRPQSDINPVRHVFSYYTAAPEGLLAKISWVEGDLEDYYSIREAMEGADLVYHCAGLVSFDDRKKKSLLRINAIGTEHVVNAALEHGVSKLCFTSSIAVLGTPIANAPANEQLIATESDFEYRPFYAKSKFLAENEVWKGIAEGINAVIVNPSVIIGPGFWNSGAGQFFPEIYKGRRYYTKGITGFTDVQDLAAIMRLLMESTINNERFVVNNANMSYQALFEKIAAALEINPPDKYATPRMTNIAWRLEALRSKITGTSPKLTAHTAQSAHNVTRYSAEKIKEQLNFNFHSLDATINHTAKCFIQDKTNYSGG